MYICFVTDKDEPLLTKDDRVLAQYLLSKNITIEAAIWDDEKVLWQQYDVIILRSTWDYHTQTGKFNKWLDQLELLSCKVLNAVSIIRWNLNKKYMLDFSSKETIFPPFQFCLQKSGSSLSAIMKANNWHKAVVKPAVSCGSFNTWVTTASSAAGDEKLFQEMLCDGDVLVQEFMDEVTENGELSLIFFNKKFSHAVLKKARPGDFRVQAKFGGTIGAIDPGNIVIARAQAILNSIDEPLLYARVDGIPMNNGDFYLMEVELIEPALFIQNNEASCESFYRALHDVVYSITTQLNPQESGC